MKRLLSIVLTAMMLVSTFVSASALTLNDTTGWVAENFELELSLDVKGRPSGTQNAYASSTPLLITDKTEPDPVGVDYKATLYMDKVRALFDEGFIEQVLPANEELRNEFNAGAVTTTINVEVTYPATAVCDADYLKNKANGVLSVNNSTETIFEETGERTIEGNTLKLSFKNKSITVADLVSDVDGKLGDISFELKDAFKYNTVSNPELSVKFSGETVIDFASKDQTISYKQVTAKHVSTITATVTAHVLEVVPAIPPTCTVAGKTEGVRCTFHGYDCETTHSVQGIVVPETIPALGHEDLEADTIINVSGERATCSEKGMHEHKTCILCKQDFMSGAPVEHSDVIIPVDAGAHTEETIPGVAATCTKTGLTNGKRCTTCGKVTVAQTVISALPHTEQTVAATAATCTTTGLTEGKICSVCSKVLVAQVIVPALGHVYGPWSVKTPATATTEGVKERSCINECGTKETGVIPISEHEHVEDPASATIITPATCTATGEKINQCACGEEISRETLPMIPHELTHVEAVAATCRETGIVEHYKCGVCAKTFRDSEGKKEITSVVTPKDINNHEDNKVKIDAIPATCEHRGLTQGEKCTACNVITIAPEIEEIIDHRYDNVPSVAATCTTTGVIAHYHCPVCNKDFDLQKNEKPAYTFVVPALGHDFTGELIVDTPKDAVNGTDGVGHLECKNGCDVTKGDIVIPAGEHKHSGVTETIIVKQATCTEVGIAKTINACCGEVVNANVVIPMKPHTEERHARVDATCHAEGVAEYYRCADCHQIIERVDGEWKVAAAQTPTVLGKMNHNWVALNAVNKKCAYCNEVVKINDASGKVDIKTHGGMKKEKDIVREEADSKFTTESEIKIEKRDEFSDKIDEKVENVAHDKAVYDIVIEKVTKYDDDPTYVELVKETEDLITIEIDISELTSKATIVVYRVHDGVSEVMGDKDHKKNGEYYEVTSNKNKIILHVKKFSEYAVVGYAEQVDVQPEETPEETPGSVLNGSASTTYTIKFNVDGGTAVDNVKVNRGEKIKAPVTTKDGYKFLGWYTDVSLTEKFDFSTPIKYSMTLYAKWEKVAEAWFIDVKENDWFYDAVKYAYDNGIMNGVSNTEFAPNASLTRAMFVTVLYRIEKEPEVTASTFTDIVVDSWYDDAVAWATKNGITNGVSETEFAPNQNILREQIAAMLFRYAQFKGYDVSADASIEAYDDAVEVSEYAIPSFRWAVGEGILNGKSDVTLAPKDNATRAEAAALLMRMIEKYNK